MLIASAHADALTAERALKAGAAGYLCKRSAPDELLRAVGLVAAGQTPTARYAARSDSGWAGGVLSLSVPA